MSYEATTLLVDQRQDALVLWKRRKGSGVLNATNFPIITSSFNLMLTCLSRKRVFF